MSPSLLVPALCLVLATSAAASAPTTLTPQDTDAILKELDRIEGVQKTTRDSARDKIISELKKRIASGGATFFVEAIEATEFEGKKNSGADFSAWREKNAEALRSSDFQKALQLHLEYLILSIQRKDAEKPELFLDPALSFTTRMQSAREDFSKKPASEFQRSLLDKPLKDSVFVKWMGIADYLAPDDQWAGTPGDIVAQIQVNLRPLLREKKDPRLTQTWDWEIQIAEKKATETQLAHRVAQFQQVDKPRLLFARAQDMVAIGQVSQGAKEMLAVVKAHPMHPDFSQWVTTLRALVQPQPAAAEPAASPEPSASPAP